MRRSITQPIIIATLVCGTLDILLAMLLTLWRGKEIGGMLRFVASGPFPNANGMGAAGSALARTWASPGLASASARPPRMQMAHGFSPALQGITERWRIWKRQLKRES